MSLSYTCCPPHQPPSLPYVTDESEDDHSMSDGELMEEDMLVPCVTFAGADRVREIPSRESFSAEEIRGTWYKKEDYQEMKRRAFDTIKLHRAGELLPGNQDHCMRGLEGRTNDGFNIVKNNRKQASYAVIDEQDRQDEIGISDSDLLAEVYQSASLHCKCVAFARGLLDAQEVIKDILTSSSQGDFNNILMNTSSDATNPQELKLLISEPSTLVNGRHQAPDPAVLLRLHSTIAEDEPEGMAVESSFQIRVQQKDADDETPLESMEWTAAKA